MKRELPLNAFPVFRALTTEECDALMQDNAVIRVKYPADTAVASDHVFCVLKGSLKVFSKNNSTQSYLRELNAGDVFGVAAIFAEQPEISVIRTETDVTLLQIPKETILSMVQKSPDFMKAYLAFLSNRIAFLNTKISCVTAGSAERKLAEWLYNAATSDEFRLPVSMSDLAKLLDLGRASLYRAFDELEAKGCIAKKGNVIQILDRELLKPGL